MHHTAWRGAGILLPAFALLCAPRVGAAVVISQVYGGGGNSGARYRRDFVELYNNGTQPVNLAGWSIRYLSANAAFPATVTPANTTPLSGSIAPGRYYLIQEEAGSGGSVELPAPDASGSLGLSSTSGKVILVRHTAPLPPHTRPPDPDIVDWVGYGNANAWEGYGPATPPSATTAIRRLGSPRGATDTDRNDYDFLAGPPDPRNSAFTGAPAVRLVSATPGAVDAGGAVLIVAEVAPGFAPIRGVTADLSSLGGGDALPLGYNASTGAYQALTSAPAHAPPGIHLVAVTAMDTQGRTGSGSGPLTVNGAPPLTVRGARNAPLGATLSVRGIVTAVHAGNAAIQDPDTLENPAGLMLSDGSSRDGTAPLREGQDVVVTGRVDLVLGERTLVLAGPSAASTQAEGRPLPVAHPAAVAALTDPDLQGKLVRIADVLVSTASGRIAAPPRGELTSFIAADTAGARIRVAIHRNATAGAALPYPAAPANPVAAAIAGDGSLTFPEIGVGDMFTVTGVLGVWPSDGMPVLRIRSADDLVKTAPRLIVSAGVSPALVEQGGTATLSVVTNPPGGVVVTADLRALGGPQAQPLAWDGTAWSIALAVAPDAPLGGVTLPVVAVSANAGAEARPRVSVISPLLDGLTIAQLRAAPDGTQARITGVVTARTIGPAGTCYLQDATGGIRVATDGPDPGYNVGDELTVTGMRDTQQGAATLDATPPPDGVGVFSLNGYGKPVPAPVAATAAQWEAHSGRLARSTSLVVLEPVAATGGDAFVVSDGTAIGELFLADRAGFTPADLTDVGKALNVTGIVDAFVSGARDTFQIRPRSPSDVSPGTPPAQVPVSLAFATQPVGGWPGQRLAVQPIVTARAADGKAVAAFTGTVKVSLSPGSGATLGGTRSVPAAAGVAAFPDLTINKAGAGYVLVARSGGLSVQSAPFSVGPPVTRGDVNGDGLLTMEDARRALQIAAGLLNASGAGLSSAQADLDGDGRVTLVDAAALRRLIP